MQKEGRRIDGGGCELVDAIVTLTEGYEYYQEWDFKIRGESWDDMQANRIELNHILREKFIPCVMSRTKSQKSSHESLPYSCPSMCTSLYHTAELC